MRAGRMVRRSRGARGATRLGLGREVVACSGGPGVVSWGDCTTWGFDTPVTRRWVASCSAKPPFGGRADGSGGGSQSGVKLRCIPGDGCGKRGGWVRAGRMVRRSRVARRGVGKVVRLQLISAARTSEVGGNCSIRSPTRRRHAVTGLLMLPNPHSARCVGGIRCPEGYARHQWVQ